MDIRSGELLARSFSLKEKSLSFFMLYGQQATPDPGDDQKNQSHSYKMKRCSVNIFVTLENRDEIMDTWSKKNSIHIVIFEIVSWDILFRPWW